MRAISSRANARDDVSRCGSRESVAGRSGWKKNAGLPLLGFLDNGRPPMPCRRSQALDIPVSGHPEHQLHEGPSVRSVALVAGNRVGLRSAPGVVHGQYVKLRLASLPDRSSPRHLLCSPGNASVAASPEPVGAWSPAILHSDAKNEEISPLLLSPGRPVSALSVGSHEKHSYGRIPEGLQALGSTSCGARLRPLQFMAVTGMQTQAFRTERRERGGG